MIEQIRIEQLELRARIGVPEVERAQPQRLLCSVAIEPAAQPSQDNLQSTIDYAALAALVRQIGNAQVFRLLETLAEHIAEKILEKFPAREIRVEIRKFALRDAAFTSVTARRAAGEK